MTTPTDDSLIVSRYGNRVVQWDKVSLQHVLDRLRGERQSYRGRYQMQDNGEDSQRLIAEAEQIKTATENHIHRAGLSA